MKTSESLISITLSTECLVDIVSMKIINHFQVYKKLLEESDLSIRVKYSNSHESFNVLDIINSIIVRDIEDIESFRNVHGNEFNSSDEHHKLFDIIDETYKDKYGHSIEEHPYYMKYRELYSKIQVCDSITSSIYERLDKSSINKYESYKDTIDKCVSYLADPFVNENIVVHKLESIISIYKKAEEEQKEDNLKKSRESRELKISKNKFGQYVYEKYNLVLDPKEKCIVGVSNLMGGTYPLDLSGVNLCKKLNLKYKIINTQ